jgi:hypothetical protein
MIASLAAYFAALAMLAAAVRRLVRVGAALGLPSVMMPGIGAVAIVYLACLIPGAIGLLYTPVVIGAICVLSSAVLLWLRLPAGDPNPGGLSQQVAERPLTWVDVTVVGTGLLCAAPLLSYLRYAPVAIRNPVIPLGWDEVSYHLPGVIEYWQNHTLWSLAGPYQSYSYGFELIGTVFSQMFFGHWGLVPAHLFAIALLVVALARLAQHLTVSDVDRGPSVWVPCATLAIGLWSSMHADAIGGPGGNDIFVTACLLAALSCLTEIALLPPDQPRRETGLLILLSVALGLAIGAKPNAYGYLPFFAVSAGILVARRGGEGTARLGRGITAAARLIAIALLFGGFWVGRNLWAFGDVSPLLSTASRLSILSNLGNPVLREAWRGTALFVLGAAACVPGVMMLWHARKTRRTATPLAVLVVFHAVAAATFVVTPLVVLSYAPTPGVWVLRLGMPMFASAFLIYSRLVCVLADWLRTRIPGRAWWLGWGSIVLVFLALPVWWQMRAVPGLPGYESGQGVPPTAVYRWIQQQGEPRRIYAAGLRPYGLYGATWRNVLFYDLHSALLTPENEGIVRIAAIVAGFKPDLILVSVEADAYDGTQTKPAVVDWMRSRQDLFREVYSDATVSGFSVLPQAGIELEPRVPAGYVLKMGS